MWKVNMKHMKRSGHKQDCPHQNKYCIRRLLECSSVCLTCAFLKMTFCSHACNDCKYQRQT